MDQLTLINVGTTRSNITRATDSVAHLMTFSSILIAARFIGSSAVSLKGFRILMQSSVLTTRASADVHSSVALNTYVYQHTIRIDRPSFHLQTVINCGCHESRSPPMEDVLLDMPVNLLGMLFQTFLYQCTTHSLPTFARHLKHFTSHSLMLIQQHLTYSSTHITRLSSNMSEKSRVYFNKMSPHFYF